MNRKLAEYGYSKDDEIELAASVGRPYDTHLGPLRVDPDSRLSRIIVEGIIVRPPHIPKVAWAKHTLSTITGVFVTQLPYWDSHGQRFEVLGRVLPGLGPEPHWAVNGYGFDWWKVDPDVPAEAADRGFLTISKLELGVLRELFREDDVRKYLERVPVYNDEQFRQAHAIWRNYEVARCREHMETLAKRVEELS